MAKEENRTSHSDAISVTVLLSGNAAHPQITAAAAAMTRAMVTSNLRLKGPPAAALRLWDSGQLLPARSRLDCVCDEGRTALIDINTR